MSEQDSPEYTPPAPNLKGFGRGSSLTGLVSADRTPASALVSTSSRPAVDRRADDSAESAPAEGVPAQEPPATSARSAAASSAPQAASTSTGERSAAGVPDLTVDMDDPAAVAVSPTVLSVPAPLMARFERARRTSTSNTELVLDALRAHLADPRARAAAGDALRSAVRRDWMLEGDNLAEWQAAWLP